jgi:putative nucleotidyltransferase with HDIG domain
VSAPPAIPAGEAGTLSSLRALLDVAAVVRSRADLQRLFEEIASTVAQALDFLAVVVNVYRPAWDDYEVVVVEGDDAAAREALLGEHVDPAQLARLFDERFRRHDAYLVPHDQFDFQSTGMTWVPGTAGPVGPDAWHPDDALLVPLSSSDGRPLAFLSLDDPVDGRRPSDSALEVVSAVAAIAAGVIEHAQLAAEAARHRASVEHLLRVSSELTTSKSRAEMLDAVCEGIRDALGFEKAAVFLDEADDGELVLAAGVGFDDVEGIGPFSGAAAMLLAETLDLRDVATARHSETVGRYAERIAAELGLAPDQVERVRVAGVLHDIGKLGISDAVLLKPGRLEPHEWQEIKRHPELGARILEHANLRDVASWVLSHHERVDGTGYPRELARTLIPLEGRILAVADAYEAMTADRPYRRALTEPEARAELRRGAGTQFDPDVIAAFERVLSAR